MLAIVLVYRLLRRFLRLVAEIFFRQIEVVGLEHVPAEGEGAVLFAGNHPNSLIDPVLIIAYSGRIVHFAAKDVLFRSRLLRLLLHGLGAVPVARRADHGEGASNEQAFAALHRVLGEGRAMGIFPEGLSHDEAHLARLKTGAARIALGACGEQQGLVVQIVPSGLTYIRRKHFRGRVLLQFGPPIVVDEVRVSAWRESDRSAVRDLTNAIETAIRALTINADDWSTLRVLDGVRRLYQPAGIRIEERVELARRFASVYPSVKDAAEVRELFTRVACYQARLDEAGLTDRELSRPEALRDAFPRLARHLALALLWVPLALPGLVIHTPIALLALFAGRTLTPRKDVLATTKLIAGVLGSLALYSALLFFSAIGFGGPGLVAALLLLPLTGFATLQVFDRFAAVRTWGRTFLRLLRMGDEVVALRAERSALESEVVRAVDRYRPEDMVPLFPRVSP